MNIINVTFHGIGKPIRNFASDERKVWLDVEKFKSILNCIERYKTVFITVDDGNISDLEIIAPELKERNLQARFFVAVGLLGQKGYLLRSDVRKLVEEGFSIGSHGMNHLDWRKLNDDNLKSEVQASRQELEQIIGYCVSETSCPFGSYDRRVLKFLKKAGYKRVYTSDRGWGSQQAWLQSRNTIKMWDDPISVEHLLSKSPLSPDYMSCRIKTAIKRLR